MHPAKGARGWTGEGGGGQTFAPAAQLSSPALIALTGLAWLCRRTPTPSVHAGDMYGISPAGRGGETGSPASAAGCSSGGSPSCTHSQFGTARTPKLPVQRLTLFPAFLSVEMAPNKSERKTRSALTDVVAREYTIRLHTAVHGKGFKHVGPSRLLPIAFPRGLLYQKGTREVGASLLSSDDPPLSPSPSPLPIPSHALPPPLLTMSHLHSLIVYGVPS